MLQLAAVAAEREAPPFAEQTFQRWWRDRPRPGRDPDPHAERTVLVWPDTFTNHYHPRVGRAAVEVLEAAGFDVVVPDVTACCGLTWISTGQLGVARRALRRTLHLLCPWLRAGTPIVGLEPSCTAVFRSDLPELLPGDSDAARLAGQTHTLAEFLLHRAPDDWQPPQLRRTAIVQTQRRWPARSCPRSVTPHRRRWSWPTVSAAEPR